MNLILASINKTILNVTLTFIVVIVVCLLALLIYYSFIRKVPPFKDTLKEYKATSMSITINLEEKTVEKYYLYDQANKNQMVSLDEFFLKFDKQNYEKLQVWLGHISRATDFNKTRRIELVMYDEVNRRRVFKVELESYDMEHERYFLTFHDITESIEVFKRADKKVAMTDYESFYDKVNEKLKLSDDDSTNFFVTIKYKEFNNINKDVRKDSISLIDANIYDLLDKAKFESDLLCHFNDGVFLMFSPNIVNIKKFKSNLKHILYSNSGTYEIAKNRFNITLCAGMTKVNKSDIVSTDKAVEAETAADAIIGKSRFADRIQMYDDALAYQQSHKTELMLTVQNTILEDKFTVCFLPIIDRKNRKVSGYSISLSLPINISLSSEEFISYAKEIGFRKTLFVKMFEKILAHPEAKKKKFYFLLDYFNLDRIMEAYNSKPAYSKIDFVFCLSFSGLVKQQNYDLIAVEKKISNYIKEDDVVFGINYNTVQTIYLNEKIYSQMQVTILSGQLVEKLLDTYSNRSLIDVYSQVANRYLNEIVAINVTSLALFEMFVHYDVNKLGGNVLTDKITDGVLTDKNTLKAIDEIEQRKY